ncbi:MAG: transcriptional regulator [Candidatus Accumulibacter sp.]|jgi:hypothetical protein|nr:transcriptional regulator [Accumulibacter sp.]
MSVKHDFAERLKEAMLQAGYEPRPSVLEKGFNTRYWGHPVTFQAAARWLKGLSLPEQDKLEVIAAWLNIEPHVLRFGDGQATLVRKKRWEDALAGPERELLETFITLPSEQKKIAGAVIVALAKSGPDADSSPPRQKPARRCLRRKPTASE